MENQYNRVDFNAAAAENNFKKSRSVAGSIGIAIFLISMVGVVVYFNSNTDNVVEEVMNEDDGDMEQNVTMEEAVSEDNQDVKTYYKTEGGKVYQKYWNNWEEIKGADSSSFEIVGDMPSLGFSKDKNYIYYNQMPIKNVDKETFTVIKDGTYLKDKNNVYTIMTEQKDGLFVLDDADPESFVVGDDISGWCARDKNYEYFAGMNITVNPNSVNAASYKERCVGSKNVPVKLIKNDKDNTANDALIECNDSWGCMIQAASTCSPAKATIKTEFDFMGTTVGSVTYMEIGKENSQCEYTQKILESYTITNGVRNEAPEGVVGMKGSCLFAMNKLTQMFTEWSKGNLSTNDLTNYGGTSCTGNLSGENIIIE